MKLLCKMVLYFLHKSNCWDALIPLKATLPLNNEQSMGQNLPKCYAGEDFNMPEQKNGEWNLFLPYERCFSSTV